jgi:RNA polymerase sigma-70 factor (ECF subfamily)
MNSYRVPLVGFVLPFVNGDVQAAEDVVQETMLRGWQHAAELVPLDERALPATDGGLDDIFDAWVVATALNSVSDEHRTVSVALFYQRRTVAEVAALLSIPEGTVRSRCFYGLRALRRTLEEQGITRP